MFLATIALSLSLIMGVFHSTVLLLSGSTLCTATAVAKHENNEYTFLTAAHCVLIRDPGTHELMITSDRLYITPNASREDGVPIKILYVGDMGIGDDFAIFRAKPLSEIPVVPLGRRCNLGEEVVGASVPIGWSKLFLKGHISSFQIERHGWPDRF